MGFWTGKVVAGLLAGATLTAGVAFTGINGIDNTIKTLDELKNKVVNYEANEVGLLSKLGLTKQEANAEIAKANEVIVVKKVEINNLKASKSKLEDDVKSLTGEVTKLKADLNTTKATLAKKEQELATKITELNGVKAQLEETQKALATLQGKYDTLLADYELATTEADRANEEVDKANKKVAELEAKNTETVNATKDSAPLTKAEMDAVSTSTDDVTDAPLAVKALNLTYIQFATPEARAEFRAANPNISLDDDDRAWRVTNNNNFDVYVNYELNGGGTGSTVAKAGQTFIITFEGGTMIIKWQDENGAWKSNVKAGA